MPRRPWRLDEGWSAGDNQRRRNRSCLRHPCRGHPRRRQTADDSHDRGFFGTSIGGQVACSSVKPCDRKPRPAMVRRARDAAGRPQHRETVRKLQSEGGKMPRAAIRKGAIEERDRDAPRPTAAVARRVLCETVRDSADTVCRDRNTSSGNCLALASAGPVRHAIRVVFTGSRHAGFANEARTRSSRRCLIC